jgi:hypothetical protein
MSKIYAYLVVWYQAGTYIAPHNNRTYYYSALLNGRLFDRINMYGEAYKEIEYHGLWLNTGLQFKASNNLQFDLSREINIRKKHMVYWSKFHLTSLNR